MGLNFSYTAGQTPIDENESDGLLLNSISTQAELNEHEQKNIELAMAWTIRKKFKAEQILSEDFIKLLHHRMFGDVWRWAGKLRLSEKNLGIKSHLIAVELKQLNDDCLYWVKNQSYGEDEIALRYKHRLVSIHCFANGNGRHARLMADVLISKILMKKVFSWGSAKRHSSDLSQQRSDYLKALKLADKGEYKDLIKFSRQ